MLEQVDASEPVLWKTALAIIAAIAVSAIVSSLVAIVMGLVNLAFQNFSEWFTDLWEQIVGGALGVYAARLVCDRLLKPYSRHVVFTVLVLLIVGAVATQYYVFHGTQWELITQGANAISTTVAAYFLFWRGDSIQDFA